MYNRRSFVKGKFTKRSEDQGNRILFAVGGVSPRLCRGFCTIEPKMSDLRNNPHPRQSRGLTECDCPDAACRRGVQDTFCVPSRWV